MPELAARADLISAPDLLYQVGAQVHCCTLDDDMVVYVPSRFETHLLDPLAAAALAWLQAQDAPCRLSDLCSAVLGSDATLDSAAARTDSQALRQLLDPLVQAGVVVALSC